MPIVQVYRLNPLTVIYEVKGYWTLDVIPAPTGVLTWEFNVLPPQKPIIHCQGLEAVGIADRS